jgi:hypothetical protein
MLVGDAQQAHAQHDEQGLQDDYGGRGSCLAQHASSLAGGAPAPGQLLVGKDKRSESHADPQAQSHEVGSESSTIIFNGRELLDDRLHASAQASRVTPELPSGGGDLVMKRSQTAAKLGRTIG